MEPANPADKDDGYPVEEVRRHLSRLTQSRRPSFENSFVSASLGTSIKSSLGFFASQKNPSAKRLSGGRRSSAAVRHDPPRPSGSKALPAHR
jgi:hypothetical protein